MKQLIALVLLVGLNSVSSAQEYPATSWTFNIDFKDPDAYAAFFGRGLVEGQYKAGAVYTPMSIYRVVDKDGSASKWFSAGIFGATNAEKANLTIGPTIGVNVLQWTSQTRLSGILDKGAKVYKPAGLASMTAEVMLWGGWTPIHTSDIKHDWEGGFGFRLKASFGGPSAAQELLKKGL